jgi:hypothetical protein
MYYRKIVHQVGYLPELYEDAGYKKKKKKHIVCFLFPNFLQPGMHPQTVRSKLPNVIFDEHLFISSWVVTYKHRQTDAEKPNGIFFNYLL